jgi:hypothetical protein
MSDPHWLVKDFHVLYRSARALAEACNGRGDGRPYPPLRALEAQLTRLRPAFDVCESERAGTPDRLTPAERKALAALHRWLHSPIGDDALTEEAADYHEQVEAESGAGACEQIEKEERSAYEHLTLEDAIELARRTKA